MFQRMVGGRRRGGFCDEDDPNLLPYIVLMRAYNLSKSPSNTISNDRTAYMPADSKTGARFDRTLDFGTSEDNEFATLRRAFPFHVLEIRFTGQPSGFWKSKETLFCHITVGVTPNDRARVRTTKVFPRSRSREDASKTKGSPKSRSRRCRHIDVCV